MTTPQKVPPLGPIITDFPMDVQSLEVPNSSKPGYSSIYRCRVLPEINSNETAYTLFNLASSTVPNNPFVGKRPWDWSKGDYANKFEWHTYGQIDELRTAVGSGLTHLARQGALGPNLPDTEWTYAYWANNAPEFQMVHQAANAYTRRLVCIYDSFDAENATYILQHSETRVVFTTSSHFAHVLSRKQDLPDLKLVVLLDHEPPADVAGLKQQNKQPPGQLQMDALAASWAKEKGVAVLKLRELIALGRANLYAHIPPKDGNAIAMLCYTSGTTGKPKAALVAHYQLGNTAVGTRAIDLNGESMLGYLPVAHIYEVLLESSIVAYGGAVGYFSGDPLRLVEDAQILQPTFFPAVPRVLNRIAAQIQAQMVGDGLKAKLLRRAIESKLAYHDADGSVHHAFWDRLVFRKVQAVLGGKVTCIVCGSAPIRPEVIKLLRVALCVDLREGYGQTENTGFGTVTNPFDPETGSVGPPQPGMEVRLKDCPELNYFSTDQPRPRGEMLIRGPSVFPGYFKDAKKTQETLDEDGWLHTGDVGAVDHKGRFYIIDRVKNLVKLSQGEYVAIEKVEQTYGGLNFLAQLWVYGDSLQDYLVAVAVPEPEPFLRFASKALGTPVSDVASLCADDKLKQAVLLELVKLGKSRGLNGVEMLKGLHLTPELFSVENGLLTPTFKTKRPEAAQYFSEQLKALYAEGPADISSARL